MIYGKTLNVRENGNYALKIGSEIIKRVHTTTFLGLHIDENLNWSEHLKYVKSKLASSLFAMRTAKNVPSTDQLKTIYNSMFHPYIEYGNILWGSAKTTILNPVEVLQKKAIRLLSNSGYNTPTKPIFKVKNILQVRDLHDLQINKCTYQYHTKNLPHSLSNLFTQNNAIHNHETRHRNDPHIIHRRTAIAAQCIIHKGPKLWQLIPQSINKFKNHPYILSQNKTKNYTSLLSTYIRL